MQNSVGDVINLISKSEIRYEGQLHSINTEENTVSLSNVRIYGTEGRKGGGVEEVPPTEQLFEFIVFRGSDIKDLTVFRDSSSPQARDPAIVEDAPQPRLLQLRRRRRAALPLDFKPADVGATEKFEGDFDFAKCREEFEKKKSEFEKAKEDAKSHAKAYDKSSFFDTISCDQKEKNSMNRAEMRKADTETFGSEMVSSMRGFRRGRGGRGRYQQR
ncbi:Scd6-like Sm domain family protein [Leishmania donovani]|uniref:Scd6-like Sm domain family protein n=1 Tax=Leishmania donovani TaxID=5661 RepID=A0A504WXS2_LEIDO|nr:Scd6-like Sm domain family protein [Leishmania donovani]TPP48976.1 Scd6-like Sm domain family protein [Leishmania donovani]